MKKYIITILLMGIALISVLVWNMKKIEDKTYKAFTDAGYILQSQEASQNEVKRYYFGAEEKYKENYNTQIVFNDTNGEKIISNKNNFIHYTDGSISSFKNGVLVEMTEVDNDPIFYYNIHENKILKKTSNKYTIQNLNKQLEFQYPLWKIDTDKYLIAGKQIKITFEDGTEKTIDGYVEIEYSDNEVVKIYNQEITYQTIAQETRISIPGNIELNLASKIIRKDNKNQMSLENMVIDSEDNVTIVDMSEKEEQTSIDEDDDPLDIDITDNDSQDNENSDNSNNNQNNNNGNNNSGSSSINGEEENEIPTIETPKFRITSFDVTTTGLTAKITITDEENLLKSNTKVTITQNVNGKKVYENIYNHGEYELDIDVQSLMPDTDYSIQVEAAYEIDSISYQKNFINKNFRTNITGADFEKDVFTNTTMSFNVIFEKNSRNKQSRTKRTYRKRGRNRNKSYCK